MYVELRSTGEMMDKSDIYIASTARTLDVPLDGADDHYHAVEDLDVDVYRTDA